MSERVARTNKRTLLMTAIDAYALPKLIPTIALRAGSTGVEDMALKIFLV